MYPSHPHQLISDAQFDQFVQDGFIILPRFIRGDELTQLQTAQRRVLRTWEQVKDNPPAGLAEFRAYPYGEPLMAGLYIQPDILKLARRFLRTEKIHVNPGNMFARYPGFVSTDPGHIDNGNNSLLPQSENREYGQIVVWMHLEEVATGQAPLHLVRHGDNKDNSKAVPLVCPEGTITLFTNYTWHFASSFTAPAGQRFAWGYMLGRADHQFEGLMHLTHLGQDPAFSQAVGRMTPEERTLFRFPPVNDKYYTRHTLALLEKQYPGWNASGAYKPTDA